MRISDWSSDVCSSDLYVDGGPSSTMTTGHLRMQGREVFRHAVVRMAEAIDAALEANGLTPGAVDWLVPHQANIRIIESMGRRLNLPKIGRASCRERGCKKV